MGKLEEIIKYSNEPKQVAKYYSLLSGILLENEEVDRIEIEVSFAPKALVITNYRLFECKSRSFGTELEMHFFVFWDSLMNAKVIKGVLSDDYEFQIGNSSVTYKLENYISSTSTDTLRFILNKIKEKTGISNGEKPGTPISKTVSEKDTSSIQSKLEELKNLFEKGLISEQDYQVKKNSLLSNL